MTALFVSRSPLQARGFNGICHNLNSLQLSVSDSDVAGLMPYNSRLGSYSGDVDELHKTAGTGLSIWTILASASNSPAGGVGGLLLNASRYDVNNNLSVVIQFFVAAESSESLLFRVIHRNKSINTETIYNWKAVSFIS